MSPQTPRYRSKQQKLQDEHDQRMSRFLALGEKERLHHLRQWQAAEEARDLITAQVTRYAQQSKPFPDDLTIALGLLEYQKGNRPQARMGALKLVEQVQLMKARVRMRTLELEGIERGWLREEERLKKVEDRQLAKEREAAERLADKEKGKQAASDQEVAELIEENL